MACGSPPAAKSSDEAGEAARAHLIEVGAELFLEVLEEPPLVVLRERVAADEPLRQANRAELEAARERQVRRRPERHLAASAADVDHDRRAAADIHAVPGGQMDEAGLFRAGDDAHADAGLPRHLGNEIPAVVRLARGARRAGDNLVNLVGIGDAFELSQRLQRRGDRGRCEAPAVEPAGAEPHHFLLAIDDLEGQVRTDPHHNHMDGIGADVDRSDVHEDRNEGRGGRSSCLLHQRYILGFRP